jgi:hypothetical protein
MARHKVEDLSATSGADDPAQSPTLDDLEAADGVAYRRLIAEATSTRATELMKQFRGDASAKP